jgi:hemerythrin superfamily protein
MTNATKSPAHSTSRGGAAKASPGEAIALLTADHKEVKQMFKAYEELVTAAGDGGEKQILAEEICAALLAHATAEEEIFYPAARATIDEQDLLDEAEVEHAGAKDLIAQIKAMDPADQLYDAKVKVLGELIDHHVEEEEGDLFPKVKKAKLDLQTLGKKIANRKEELLAEMGVDDPA